MLPELSKRYKVITMDFIGMGLSDRQKFKIESNPRSVVNFFVESIQVLVEKLGLTKFRLAGHSFGGYMSTHYALRHPELVEEVFLLSPMASTRVAPENDLSNEENYEAFIKK